MAYIVATRPGRYEVRESRQTPKGPRSRTLASFAELDDEVIAKVQARAAKPPTAAELREGALRAGAPIGANAVDRAARETVRQLARGERLSPRLRRLLLGVLGDDGDPERPQGEAASDTARAAAQWIDADPGERSQALRDLLELADALPVRPRPRDIGFPRLRST